LRIELPVNPDLVKPDPALKQIATAIGASKISDFIPAKRAITPRRMRTIVELIDFFAVLLISTSGAPSGAEALSKKKTSSQRYKRCATRIN
jgi:hypothetical protein